MQSSLKTIFIALFVIWPFVLQAETPSIEVRVDRDTLTTRETLNLSIVIKGGSALSTPDIPNRGNFDVVGQSTGNAIEIINGQMSVTKSFDYVLKPRGKGNFTIGPIKAHIEGTTYSSSPIKVTVLEDDQKPTYQPAIPPPIQGQRPTTQPPPPPGWSDHPSGVSPPSSQDRGLTFLTAQVDKNEAYVGEQILFTFRLYSGVSLANAQLSLPDFKEFISEELIKERKYQVDLEGKRYAVNEWRIALFSTKAGKLATGPSSVKASVSSIFSRRPPFNDPFYRGFPRTQRMVPKTFTAPSVTIEVKNLPPAPQGFLGLVGNFKISSHLTQDVLNLGDTTNLEVEVSGTGNINEANLPPLASTPFFKVYPGNPSLDLRKSLQGLSGKKKFTYALVADRPGETTIPSMNLYYFNPQLEKYEKLSTTQETVRIQGRRRQEKLVTAGIDEPGGMFAPPPRALDLRELKPPSDILFSQALAPWEALLWWILLLGSPVTYLGFGIWEKGKKRALAQADDKKRSKAFKRAKVALGQTLKVDGGGGFSQFTGVLKGYISDRFLIKGAALTPLEVERLLQSKRIPEEVVRRMVYLLEQLDSWKYGGMKNNLPPETELKTEITNLLREIEKAA